MAGSVRASGVVVLRDWLLREPATKRTPECPAHRRFGGGCVLALEGCGLVRWAVIAGRMEDGPVHIGLSWAVAVAEEENERWAVHIDWWALPRIEQPVLHFHF